MAEPSARRPGALDRVHPSRVVRALRRRVRLRTRLRRAARAGRRAFARRLPAWSDQPPVATSTGDGPYEIVVGTAGELRRHPDGRARSVRLVVRDWRAPYPGWSGRLGPLPGLVRHELVLPESGRGRAELVTMLARPLPLAQIVAAAHRALEPLPPPIDVRTAGAAVVVDAGAANPRGRQRYGPKLPAGELTAAGGGWAVVRVPDGTTVVAGRSGEPLDERQRAVLAELGLVTCDLVTAPPDVVVALAMTGVVVHAPEPPAGARGRGAGTTTPPAAADQQRRVHAELAGILAAPLPPDDPMEWELRSVRQRRAAMRHHAGLAPPPVSALLVTMRPQLAAGAVAALAAQTYPELEIVVGLHGAGAPAGLRDAAAGRPVQVLHIPAERNLGEALDLVTRAAHGRLLTKVDDDDHYGAGHVWDLVLAHHFSGAAVVGKGSEFVHLAPLDCTVRRRMGAEFFTDTVAGGTMSLTPEDLAAVGGWPARPRHVDRALLDRVVGDGGLVYRTHPIGFIYTRHGHGHTWEAELDHFRHDAQRTWRGLPPYEEFALA